MMSSVRYGNFGMNRQPVKVDSVTKVQPCANNGACDCVYRFCLQSCVNTLQFINIKVTCLTNIIGVCQMTDASQILHPNF